MSKTYCENDIRVWWALIVLWFGIVCATKSLVQFAFIECQCAIHFAL